MTQPSGRTTTCCNQYTVLKRAGYDTSWKPCRIHSLPSGLMIGDDQSLHTAYRALRPQQQSPKHRSQERSTGLTCRWTSCQSNYIFQNTEVRNVGRLSPCRGDEDITVAEHIATNPKADSGEAVRLRGPASRAVPDTRQARVAVAVLHERLLGGTLVCFRQGQLGELCAPRHTQPGRRGQAQRSPRPRRH